MPMPPHGRVRRAAAALWVRVARAGGVGAWGFEICAITDTRNPCAGTMKITRQPRRAERMLHAPISIEGLFRPMGKQAASKSIASRRPCSTMPSRSSRANLTSDRGIVRQVRTPSISFDDPAQRSRRDTFAASVLPRQTAKTLGTNRRAGTAHRSSRGKSSEREGSHEVRHF